MNMGIHFWKFIKSFQVQKAKKPTTPPKNVLYIGSDNPIYEGLVKHYSKSKIHLFAVCETRVISRYDDLEKIENVIKEKKIDEIVFDNQSNTFSKILFYMTSLKNKNILFKIHPKNTDFIIGSNDKDDKGEVYFILT